MTKADLFLPVQPAPIDYAVLTIDDYEPVIRLWSETEGICLSAADSREALARYLERNPGLSLVARAVDGLIVGAVLGGHDGRRGLLHHLAVAPEWRRRGIARQLVERALDGLRDAGIQKCFLFILDTNTEGQAFWEQAGWTPTENYHAMALDLGRRCGPESR